METQGVERPWSKCWVVGHGFLGAALAASLRRAGADVLTLDAVAPADVVGDAADETVLQRALQLLVPQVVFCCQATGGGSPADYRHTYGDVVRQLLSAHLRVVFCSSISVYGAASGAVNEETYPIAPSERAQVLLEAEAAVRKCGGIVLRMAALYGVGRCEVLRRHLAGEARLPGPAERLLSYVHVDDAVEALILAGQAGMGNMEAGNSYEMYGVAASVIGGISPLGGTGLLLGSFAGAGVWQTLENGLGIIGAPVGIQRIVIGVIVAGAVLIDVVFRQGAGAKKAKK